MAGRPQLRIGTHGQIKRINKGGGVWLARCRYRDTDGVTRIVQRLGPADEYDQHGKLAADALIAALAERKRSGNRGEIGPETKVTDLVEQHLTRLAEDGRSPVTMSTYRFTTKDLKKFIGGLRVREATPARMDAALRSMRSAHGATKARQSKTILRGALQLAVMASVLSANPVRDVQPLRSKTQPKGAVALTADQLRELLANLRASAYCEKHDLVDPITLLIATGLRRSELLGLRWTDFDEKANMLAVTGKVIRVPSEGLLRVDETKSTAGRRTVPLPKFAVEMLLKRRQRPYLGEQAVIFPSTAGTLRDPNNFGKEWRTARKELGVADVTTHSFRKTVATLIDDEGLSARIGADHLGHSHVSMTQDRYMTRGRIHTQVADLLDRTVRINDE
ncbi:Tyrosine recombinase XerD [Mycobacterium attenuatum]|uniref:site-specific integrase n=1 Tax=Mycobacterium attenuatum TaxID=2341086 RepID=UPI000F03BE5E|nr:site-specific integrase [Mycobacterium attenuatum]VBA60558.1 Tyrosine recombinase XerD [Mycobacterium attenuatum]